MEKSILMFVRNDSRFQDLMLQQEVFVMMDMFTSAGYTVDVCTTDDQPLTGEATLSPNKQLGSVTMSDYDGLMLPCMAPDPALDAPDVMVDLARQAGDLNLPIGAMRGSVKALAKAGALSGRRYSFAADMELAHATYMGTGVTKDGLIATAGSCPAVAAKLGGADDTVPLTEAFLEIVRAQ